MFYKLSDNYLLEGWRKLPTGVVHKKTNAAFFLPREEYRLLLHMNGKEKIDSDMLTPTQQASVSRLLDQGIIQKSDRPFSDSENTFYRFYDNAYINSVQWSVTGKCNYQCRHCLLSAPENCEGELTTRQCLDIIRQMKECGIHQVSLTGGEPLVRKDFMVLVKACTDAGIQITELYTNGALLTPELLDEIISYGQSPQIQISYDGIGWHDWVRGIDGAQKIAEKAFITAHEAGLKTVAAMSIFKDNAKSIRETVNLLASLHVDYIKIAPMLRLGLWEKHYADKTLTTEELLDVVLEYIPDFFADGKPCSLEIGGFFAYFKENDISTTFLAKSPECPAPVYPCQSVASRLYVGSDGRVFPCMEFACLPEQVKFHTIQEVSLREMLQDSVLLKIMQTKLEDVYSQDNDCRDCPEKGIHCYQHCLVCTNTKLCGIDSDTCKFTCSFVKNRWFQQIEKCVKKAGGRFILPGEKTAPDNQ